jgi:pimeloyl-ACP methyl ester carboxylesterase
VDLPRDWFQSGVERCSEAILSNLNQQIKLPDGRRLGYDERGPENGTPLLYFHGSPSSRLESKLYISNELLRSLNVHLIAVDRPGLGLSDFQPNRRLLDWPQDVLNLADQLNIERFAILAYSGGGPYGAVCALSIPHLMTRVGIVSGTAPFNQPGLTDGIPANNLRYFALSIERPWLGRLMLRMIGATARFAPNKMVANAHAALPEPDRLALDEPEDRAGFLSMILDALRQGPRGAQHDTRLMVTDWDFRPQEIQMPVLLWHGEMDKNAPIAMGRFMANAIPKCEVKFYPGEGHLSLFKKNAETIIHALVN